LQCKEVTIPAEVASLVRELVSISESGQPSAIPSALSRVHTPKTEETQAVKSSIFANTPKCYKYGSFFRVSLGVTVFQPIFS
ncbi:hypothetical protein TELCIR_02119, partial [Teladorsagia circumcincta]